MTSPILSARNVVAGYAPGLPIVHDVSADVSPGEIVTIIGPNGAGKSTFLKAIAGLVRFEGGDVQLAGRDVSGLPAHEMVRVGIGFVPQTGNIFTSLSIHENLVLGGHSLGASDLKRGLERAYGLSPFLAQRRSSLGRVLSGGQRQMLAVARALMTNPSVIMLDEPTAGLAPRVVGEVFADLRRLAESGVAVLMVEQNARAALRVSDRGYVLAEGRNRLDGKAADLLADAAVGEAFLGGGRRAS
ncbi:MAG: ABC transporter ATP-binding protein [Beijerinckiaceae bacterium]